MKKKLLAILLTVCMVLSMASTALAADSVFTDVNAGDWFAEEVKYVYDNGLMNGVGDNAFDPSGTVTRAMVWTTLARLDGVNTTGSDPWWLTGQQWAMESEISDGTMATENITREQLVTMIWRYAKYINMDVSEVEDTNMLSYTDALDVNEWAVSAMQWACAVGIINGINGALQPQGDASRAMLAVILYRFVEEVMPEVEEPEEPEVPEKPSTPTPSIPVHFHSWTAGTPVLPTCTSEGYTPYTCSCGSSKNDDFVPAVEHVVGEKCPHCGVTEVETAEQLIAAAEGEGEVKIKMVADITIDVAAWQHKPLGGESTTSITIDGENGDVDYTLTFNQTNSDWNNVVTNNGAKLVLKNINITNSGHNDGPWNRHNINFGCDVEMENVNSDKALAFKADAALINVTIDDANTSDTYAIWIQPNGQTVTLEGCTVDMLDCTDGRGIKIDEQYVDAPAKVTLTVSDTTFKTEEKSAILVKSKAGADITLSDVDISGVAADNVNEVWVDSDSAAYQNLVTVTGGNKILEGAVAKIGNIYFGTFAKALTAAQDGDTITLLVDGIYTMASTSVDMTIIGTKDTKVELPYGSISGNGNVITFDGITVMGETNSAWYSTLFNGAEKIIYKNCNIYNQLTTYCDSEFTNCKFYNTFDNDYSVYCYSGSNIKFDGCSFDSKCSKAIKVYDEGNGGRNVYVNNCSFTTETADKKAAVEIDSTYSTYHIYFTGENNISGEYTKLWNSDPGEDQGTNVYVDGILQKAAATQDALNSAVSGSNTEVEVDLAAGSYTMPTTSGDVTISGTKDTVISGNTCTADNVTFNGVTIQSTGAAYTGIQHSDEVVYNDVTIIGNMYLYAEKVVFNNCTFDLSATNDYIWVYGATDVEFNNCTFNTMGKAILVFQDGSAVDQTVKVEGCTFNASAPAYNWDHTIHISAVSIDGSQGGTYNVILNNNTVDTDFNGLWQDKTNAGNITVTVDGTTALAPNT